MTLVETVLRSARAANKYCAFIVFTPVSTRKAVATEDLEFTSAAIEDMEPLKDQPVKRPRESLRPQAIVPKKRTWYAKDFGPKYVFALPIAVQILK